MDVKFRILWVEDTREWYGTISRRLERYIESKALIPEFERIAKSTSFSLAEYDISKYDLLFVDYELEKVKANNGVANHKHGTDIIELVREGKFYNDVLFYSSHGYDILESVLKENGLQGVFISDRKNSNFLECACALVDKAVRRSENLINIRGVVMDTTSGFDMQIEELILKMWKELSTYEESSISGKIVKDILKNSAKGATKIVDQFPKIDSTNIEELLNKREFTADHKAHLLSWCIEKSATINSEVEPILDKAFSNETNKRFYQRYSTDIIGYRNALAHAKELEDDSGMKYVGEINGQSVEFGAELCETIRKKMLQYTELLNHISRICDK